MIPRIVIKGKCFLILAGKWSYIFSLQARFSILTEGNVMIFSLQYENKQMNFVYIQ